MSSSGRRIIGHSGIYLLGSLLARAVSFIMLPIYTRNLTPADYGIIELLTMIIDLVGLLVSVRIGQSIYRYYHKYDHEDDRRQVLFSSYATTLSMNLFAMLIVVLFSQQLSLAVFGRADMVGMIRLFSLSLVLQGLIETPMVMLRAQQKPWIYLAASIARLLMMLSLNIYFVVFKKMHVEGVVYSSLISGGVSAIVLGAYLINYTKFSFSMPKVREMMRFSLPFIAVGLLSYYINFGDRYFIRLFGGGLDAVGIYSLGYKFGFLLTFIVGDPFSNIWDTEKFRIYKESSDPITVYRTVFLGYMSVISVVFLGISLFGNNIIQLMANKEYWSAAELIPVVCMAYVFNCMNGYTTLGLLIKERTGEFTYGSIIAAVVVTVGYLTLIPRYGAMGAALATLLAFGARLIWLSIRSRKYYDMKLDWGRVIVLWLTVGLIWKIAESINFASIYLSLVVNSAAVLLNLLVLLFSPILPEQIRKVVRTWFIHPKESLRAFRDSTSGNST